MVVKTIRAEKIIDFDSSIQMIRQVELLVADELLSRAGDTLEPGVWHNIYYSVMSMHDINDSIINILGVFNHNIFSTKEFLYKELPEFSDLKPLCIQYGIEIANEHKNPEDLEQLKIFIRRTLFRKLIDYLNTKKNYIIKYDIIKETRLSKDYLKGMLVIYPGRKE